MPLLKVPEPYAVNTAYAKVADAARMIGEEIIALNMYRVGVDDETAPRCVCFNDVYENSQQYECPSCFGTTFSGGVKAAWRIWAIFNDVRNDPEHIAKAGVYLKGTSSVQTEPWPALYENDYLVRVSSWDIGKNSPLTFAERYLVQDSQNFSIRSGNMYGNADMLQVAQLVSANLLPPNHFIYRFNIMAQVQFPRADGEVR
jgi:hypothetical protein